MPAAPAGQPAQRGVPSPCSLPKSDRQVPSKDSPDTMTQMIPRSDVIRRLLPGLAGLWCGCGSPAAVSRSFSGTGVLTIAAAASLRPALTAIAAAFGADSSNPAIRPVFGASGHLFAQLLQQAPFDVFLSADRQYPDALVHRNIVRPEQVFCYARGRLVLCRRPGLPPASAAADLQQILQAPAVRTIAIANPRTAPYGRAAQEVLRQLLPEMHPDKRIVRAEHVLQVVHFVRTGAADVGITALSAVVTEPPHQPQNQQVIPETMHAPIDHYGAIPDGCSNRPAAERFRSFLCGPPGRRILKQHGFLNPESL